MVGISKLIMIFTILEIYFSYARMKEIIKEGERYVNVVYDRDKLTEELYGILDDLLFFAKEHYRVRLYKKIEWMILQLGIREDFQGGLFKSFIWIVIFCDRDADGLTIYQHYLNKRRNCLEGINIKLRNVLFSWLELRPGFYRVTEAGNRSGSIFIFQDVIHQRISVVYCNHYPSLKNGDLISGLLMPFGEDFYCTISSSIEVNTDTPILLDKDSKQADMKSLKEYIRIMKLAL